MEKSVFVLKMNKSILFYPISNIFDVYKKYMFISVVYKQYILFP